MSVHRTLLAQKTFRFNDALQPHSAFYCDLNILVNVKQIDGDSTEYYEILYNPDYSHNTMLQAYYCNPLSSLDESAPAKDYDLANHEHYDCDIVAKNPMTDKMIEFILMDFDELEKWCGKGTPQEYKRHVILSLNMFWE